MTEIECSTISLMEILTLGLPYTVSKNKGVLTLANNKIVFKKDSKVEWEILFCNLKEVKGLFYLHLKTKDGKKKIIRTSKKNLKTLKKEIKNRIN